MAKAKLTTLFSLEEDIELPETCPNCGADLREKHSLDVWEWSDQSRPARLPKPGEVPDYGNIVYDWHAGLRGGDNVIDEIAYYCRACEKTLAEAPCWDLNIPAQDTEDPPLDAQLQDAERQATLDCGCILRRDPVSIEFCELHRAVTPYATRRKEGRLYSVVSPATQIEAGK
jgi:hypothetical protein